MKEYKYKINGIKFNVGVGDLVNDKVEVVVNGTHYNVELDEENKPKSVKAAAPKTPGAAPRTATGESVLSKPAAPAGKETAVKSPLPGTIMSIAVNVGDTVKAGDTVCVLEAMKMENDVHTPVGGTVKKILASVGDALLEGNDIMIIG